MDYETRNLNCRKCGYKPSIKEFIDSCKSYWWAVDVIKYECPKCNNSEDVRVENSNVYFGYVYSAGAPHYAPMELCIVEGLTSRRTQKKNIYLEFENYVKRIGKD